MNIKPYLLFAFVIIGLPCVSVAEQSEQCAANQKASAERCTASQKASAERCTASQKASAERCTASQKASAERCTASQKAGAKGSVASQKANAEACAASQKANAEVCAASQKANAKVCEASQKTTSQTATVYEAFKDEETDIFSVIKRFFAGLMSNVDEINVRSPMINQSAIIFTDTQKQTIGAKAQDLIDEPTKDNLEDIIVAVDRGALGLRYDKTLIRDAIINEALRQCLGCPSDKVSALKALKK